MYSLILTMSIFFFVFIPFLYVLFHILKIFILSYQYFSPHKNYTVAVLGLSPTYKIDECPYQQIIPIDSIVDVQDAEGKILHLKHRVNRTRHVQPIFLEKK